MNAKERSDFTQGSILKKMIPFMMPILGALILQAAYGAVDLLVVGRFGTTAGLSAVSTGSQILNLVTFVITQLAMGITVLIARYIGEKHTSQIGELLGGATTVFTMIAVVLFVVMVFFAKPLAVLMQAPQEALMLTSVYVRICGGGIFFIVAYNVLSAIFRGLGDSRSPLIFVMVACVVNVVGDLVLVAGFHLDAAGAAIATVLAQAVSVVLEASSGYGVACKIVNFAMLIPSALMQSMASFVSQNVGAGKEDRAKKAMFTGMGIGLIVGIIVFASVWFFGDVLTSIFTTDEAVVQKGFEYLKGFAPETILTAILFSMIGYFNGHEKTLWVMIQGLIQTLLVRLPLAYFMSIQPDASLTNIGLAAPVATCFGIILNVIFFLYMTRKMKKA